MSHKYALSILHVHHPVLACVLSLSIYSCFRWRLPCHCKSNVKEFVNCQLLGALFTVIYADCSCLWIYVQGTILWLEVHGDWAVMWDKSWTRRASIIMRLFECWLVWGFVCVWDQSLTSGLCLWALSRQRHTLYIILYTIGVASVAQEKICQPRCSSALRVIFPKQTFSLEWAHALWSIPLLHASVSLGPLIVVALWHVQWIMASQAM